MFLGEQCSRRGLRELMTKAMRSPVEHGTEYVNSINFGIGPSLFACCFCSLLKCVDLGMFIIFP